MNWIKVTERLPGSSPVLVFVVMDAARPGQTITRRLRAVYARENSLELGGDQAWFDGCTEDEEGNTFCAPGWYESNEFEDTHWLIDGDVTHWMPLPDPPRTEEK